MIAFKRAACIYFIDWLKYLLCLVLRVILRVTERGLVCVESIFKARVFGSAYLGN